MEQPDERIWELEISQCDDGDILLEQGRCGGCNDALMIRLHRSQIQLIAELGGFLPADNVARATERLRDRLSLTATLVRTHTKPDEPLRIIFDDLIAGGWQSIAKPLSSPLEASSLLLDDSSLPSVAGCASGHPEHRNEDLFSTCAEEM